VADASSTEALCGPYVLRDPACGESQRRPSPEQRSAAKLRPISHAGLPLFRSDARRRILATKKRGGPHLGDLPRRRLCGATGAEATRSAPGTSAWFQARAAVQHAILARRPARDAKLALIDFVIRERPQLTPSEAAYALDVWSVEEQSLRGTSDTLVDLLAGLAGIRIDQWPP
jgi:hypothetical protein